MRIARGLFQFVETALVIFKSSMLASYVLSPRYRINVDNSLLALAEYISFGSRMLSGRWSYATPKVIVTLYKTTKIHKYNEG